MMWRAGNALLGRHVRSPLLTAVPGPLESSHDGHGIFCWCAAHACCTCVVLLCSCQDAVQQFPWPHTARLRLTPVSWDSEMRTTEQPARDPCRPAPCMPKRAMLHGGT
jgi:hypothetical protein